MARETENTAFIGGLVVLVLGLFQFIRTLINSMYDGRKTLQAKNDELKAEITKLQIELMKEQALKERYKDIARQKHREAAIYKERLIGAMAIVQKREYPYKNRS
jgi:hypothetical protein